MSRAANLHPLVVVVSVASGAVLGGVIGAVVAVPLVSTSWGVINYLRVYAPIGAVVAPVVDDTSTRPRPYDGR